MTFLHDACQRRAVRRRENSGHAKQTFYQAPGVDGTNLLWVRTRSFVHPSPFYSPKESNRWVLVRNRTKAIFQFVPRTFLLFVIVCLSFGRIRTLFNSFSRTWRIRKCPCEGPLGEHQSMPSNPISSYAERTLVQFFNV